MTDPANCGSCGHSCTNCAGGQCSDDALDPDAGDVSVDPDAPPDVAEVAPDDVVGDPDQEAVETTPEVELDSSADIGRDGCVPHPEECNGVDDDCDGDPDDGIECGTCPDPDRMVLISRPELPRFCVDLYEASRPDASISTAGTDTCATSPTDPVGCTAHSKNGVLPWNLVDLETAENACDNVGKRLCTADEWVEACGGPSRNLYPYSATQYEMYTCNGAGDGVNTPEKAGAFLDCISPEGLYDMSGNLAEWVDDETARGGGYNDNSLMLRCTDEGQEPDTAGTHLAVGFRCCANAIAP